MSLLVRPTKDECRATLTTMRPLTVNLFLDTAIHHSCHTLQKFLESGKRANSDRLSFMPSLRNASIQTGPGTKKDEAVQVCHLSCRIKYGVQELNDS